MFPVGQFVIRQPGTLSRVVKADTPLTPRCGYKNDTLVISRFIVVRWIALSIHYNALWLCNHLPKRCMYGRLH